jgi:hypothetical protein
MNSSIKRRLKKLEDEQSFQSWLDLQRFLETLTEEHLEIYVETGRLPDPLPSPIPHGKSKLDYLDSKTLIRWWQDDERKFANRSEQECEFYVKNGHWPEQPNREAECDRIRKEVAAGRVTIIGAIDAMQNEKK